MSEASEWQEVILWELWCGNPAHNPKKGDCSDTEKCHEVREEHSKAYGQNQDNS